MYLFSLNSSPIKTAAQHGAHYLCCTVGPCWLSILNKAVCIWRSSVLKPIIIGVLLIYNTGLVSAQASDLFEPINSIFLLLLFNLTCVLCCYLKMLVSLLYNGHRLVIPARRHFSRAVILPYLYLSVGSPHPTEFLLKNPLTNEEIFKIW